MSLGNQQEGRGPDTPWRRGTEKGSRGAGWKPLSQTAGCPSQMLGAPGEGCVAGCACIVPALGVRGGWKVAGWELGVEQ